MIHMKKQTIAILLLAAFAADAGAQTVADALRFSDNNYYGTARSISMGNAFTALGGDLGSISLNPAGSGDIDTEHQHHIFLREVQCNAVHCGHVRTGDQKQHRSFHDA